MRNKNAKVSNPNDFSTPCGSSDRTLYSTKVTPDGKVILTPSGKENVQEYIDSFRESTDMAFILHQMALGNMSVLNQREAMYGDFTDLPENLAEMQQIFIDGENAFNQLPLDVRQQFDNNYRNWLFTSGSEDWNEKMKKLIPEPIKEEVKESDNIDVS